MLPRHRASMACALHKDIRMRTKRRKKKKPNYLMLLVLVAVAVGVIHAAVRWGGADFLKPADLIGYVLTVEDAPE